MNKIGRERLTKAEFHLVMAEAMLAALITSENTYETTEIQREGVRHLRVQIEEAIERLTMLYSNK